MFNENNFILKFSAYFRKQKALPSNAMNATLYNTTTSSCQLIPVKNENSPCNVSNGCGDITLKLWCDSTTNTCKRTYLLSCLQDSDCMSSLKCIQNFCVCVRKKFFYQI